LQEEVTDRLLGLALKKKHSKTGEESRYQGTALGKDAESQKVSIVGGPGTLAEWRSQQT